MKYLLPLLLLLTACNENDAGQGFIDFAPSQPPLITVCTDKVLFKQIQNSQISVIMTNERAGYPAATLLDNNPGTMVTTWELHLNDRFELVFDLGQYVDLHSIEILNEYSNSYALGDIDIYASYDQNTWTLVQSMDSVNNNFLVSSNKISVLDCSIRYVRLNLKYTGTGGFGGSPSFYMTDVKFYQFVN